MTTTTGPFTPGAPSGPGGTERRSTKNATGTTNSSIDSNPSESPLEWLSQILWPSGEARLQPAGEEHTAATPNAPGNRQWWASPSADQAEILVPADPVPAQAAVRRYHDGFSIKKRARSWAAEAVMHLPGMPDRLLGSHLVVVEGHSSDRTLDLLQQLGELVGQPDLRVAVSLARPKSNRKPVLQMIAPDGSGLGWAKIGWTDWTTNLISNEAFWLLKNSDGPLVKPVLLHDVDLCGHRVVVTSGVMGSRLPRRGTSDSPNIELVAAIAAMGTATSSPVTGLPWWTSVTDVLGAADPAELDVIRHTADSVAGRLITSGAWHGDLTPWNIMSPSPRSAQQGLQVIDWEFAADGVPLGFDVCHFHTQVATELRGMDPDQALDYSARRSPQDLASLGVDPHNQIATWQLYLVELMRRTLALRQAGFGTENVHQGAAAARRLNRIHQGRPKADRKA